MKLALIAFAAVALPAAFLVAPASAADDDAERIGEVHITLKNAAYTKVAVNGAEYSATEFARSGKKLLIKGLALTDAPFKITLTPFEDTLDEATVEVTEKQFRRKRSGRIYILVATPKPVKFGKKADAPAPTPDTPEKAPEEPEPSEPDEDDDL